MTDNKLQGENEQSEVFIGGLGASLITASEYHIIEGETSLCNAFYRRLGHRSGAKFAVTWDYKVSGEGDVPQGVELCEDCAFEGGWGAVLGARIDSTGGDS